MPLTKWVFVHINESSSVFTGDWVFNPALAFGPNSSTEYPMDIDEKDVVNSDTSDLPPSSSGVVDALSTTDPNASLEFNFTGKAVMFYIG